MPFTMAFDDPHGLDQSELNRLVGGKGANLALMTSLGLPVPPGFSISTTACVTFLDSGWPPELDAELTAQMDRLGTQVGRRFGDPADPLLVSVRSGAPVSMPGMMDTILDLGLNDETTKGLGSATGDMAFAEACRARFIAQYRDVVGVEEVPEDPWAQLRSAIEAVFRSWNSDRARAYRAREGIPEDLGTGVTVQAMVFGNRGQDSATGVLFTRDPATGAPTPFGDVLFDAQGEDVVAGTHQTLPISTLDARLPDAADALRRHADVLERHLADCCDIEFTIERGRLWLLQVRNGKRSPQAALRMAVDMAEQEDFPLTRAEAVRRVSDIVAVRPTSAGRITDRSPIGHGLPASPGVASGEVAIDCAAAIAAAEAGHDVLLVRSATSPDDVAAMARSVGILTSTGGAASHAAVVARGWGIPAVVGASSVQIEEASVRIGDTTVQVGDAITIDGATGEVFLGAAEGGHEPLPEVAVLLDWARSEGIEIPAQEMGTPDAGGNGESGTGEPVPETEVTDDLVLRTLLIKGYVSPDALLSALGGTSEDAASRLDTLVERGLAEAAAGAFRLTAQGRQAATGLLAEDAERWGQPQAEAALDGFLSLDRRMKQTVTDWQLREVDGEQVVNDHSDPDHDAAVIEALGALHADTLAWLSPSIDGLPRLSTYGARLERAMGAVSSGDQRYVASPRVDSYHSVWFELHEDLILLAGRTREDEVAAGRA